MKNIAGLKVSEANFNLAKNRFEKGEEVKNMILLSFFQSNRQQNLSEYYRFLDELNAKRGDANKPLFNYL